MIGRARFAFALFAATATCASAQESAPPQKGETQPQPPGDTIVVRGKKPPVQRTLEGTAHDVRDNAQGEAGTAADVLNTVPSVNVSPDGKVTVRGDGNVQVYVNGRPSAAMNGESRASALQAMSGGSIASVEVITNPSARFDANGGAIVNIVLKKNQGEGLHGGATVNAGDRGRRNASVNASWGAGRLSTALSLSLRDDVRLTSVRDDRRLFDADGELAARFVSDARYTPTHRRQASFTGSLGYALTPAADLGADLTMSRGSPHNKVYERHLDYQDAGPPSEYRRARGGTYVTANRDLSLWYDDRGTAGGASLKLVAQHSLALLRSDRLFTTFHDLPPLAASGERVFNRSVTRIDRVSLDHVRPAGRRLRLGLGAEWKREESRYHNGRGPFDPAAPGDPLQTPVALSAFKALQRTAALYATVELRSGAWTLQAGERFEDLRVDVALAPERSRTSRTVAGFNHSFSALRELGDDQLIFRLSRTRPRFDPADLNPALVYVDAQNAHAGNPFLAPQDVTAAEAEYGFSRGGRDGAATLYWRRTDDTIADVAELLPGNVLIARKRNGGRSQSLGAQLTLSDRLGKALKYSLTLNLFRARLSTPEAEGMRLQSRLSCTAQASLDWTVTARDQLRLDANVQGPTLVPQGLRTGAGAANFVWRHKLSPQWTLSLTAQGMLLDDRVRTLVRTPHALTLADRRNGGRAVLVGASWKFR